MKKRSLLIIALLCLLLCNFCSNSEESANGLNDPQEPDTTGNTGQQVGIELVLVSAGTFTMGSSESYAEYEGERPAHEVTISNDFYLGAKEITQAEYQAVMGENPSTVVGENFPVTNVTWQNAVDFCARLSQATGETYRLPTDAEWELAQRAGTNTRFFWGDDESATGDYCWFEGNSNSAVNETGVKTPNAIGLHDMAGNVEEWVSDLYNRMSVYVQTDPQGPSRDMWGGTTNHVLRGGNYQSSPRFLQACWRHGDSGGMPARGFRVLKEVE